MLVEPSELVEVIDSMPAIVENCFSKGVATGKPLSRLRARKLWTRC